MKAITLWQPWASLIAAEAKHLETRSWEPPLYLIGKRIAIHSAKITIAQVFARGALSKETAREIILAFRRPGERNTDAPITLRELEHLPLGAVVCTALLKSATRVPTDGRAFTPPDVFGDYSPGRWVWLLDQVERLDPPVPARGAQGWFDVELPAGKCAA